jgi:hypothetical protein
MPEKEYPKGTRNEAAHAAVKLAGKQGKRKTDSLRPNPWNPNKQSDFMYDKEKKSIQRFGFLDPITVRSGNQDGKFKDGKVEIIDGEHRWRAATDLELKEVSINDLGNLPDAEAKALTIALNELHGEADKVKQAELVTALVTDFPDIAEVLPFTDIEIEEFKGIVDFDWDGLDGEKGGGGGGNGDDLVTLQVKLTKDQKAVIDQAIDRAKAFGENMSIALALEHIAADFLASPGPDGEEMG